MMEYKICTICKTEKQINEFSKNLRYKSGIDNICKECNRIRVAKYRRNNPEKIKQDKIKWREENREKYLEYHRNYSQTRRPKHKEKARDEVSKAVSRGDIPHPTSLICEKENCNNQAAEYHHYKDYSKENWFAVKALCFKCHGLEHRIYDF